MPSPRLICLEPTNAPRLASTPRRLAPRPSSFDDSVMGLVSNTLGRSQELLAAIHRELTRGAAGTQAIEVVKPHKSVPPSPVQWAELRARATLALTGFGG